MKQVADKTGNTFMPDNHVPPHITISVIETKHEELAIKAIGTCVQKLQQGFQILQKRFASFEGRVIWIGIAKTNPHRDLCVWELHN